MDIKSMLIEAGIYQEWMEGHEIMEVTMSSLERFAALVAEAERKRAPQTCEKHCERNAYQLEIRHLKGIIEDYRREALAQPQENTARCGGCNKTAKDGWALYCVECWEKTQPQGKWVDLTEDELLEVMCEMAASNVVNDSVFAKAVIAKFKEKNTPPVVPQGEPVAWVIWGEGNVPELAWDTPKPDDVANALYYTPPSSQLADAAVEAAIEATKEKMKKVFAVATPKSTWTTDRIIAEIEDMK
jgi:hypothetical protein